MSSCDTFMQLKIYTIEEVAEILKVHRTYVASLIAEKKLTAIKIGRFYRIQEKDIETLINGKLDGAILTIEDIAETLKVHRTYVARLVREQKIKAVQIGKLYRIREKDFNAFIKKSEI